MDLPVDRTALVRYAEAELADLGLDRQLAEDIVQEALVRWMEHREEINQFAHGGWLRSTVGNLIKQQGERRLGRRRHDPLDEDHFSLDAPWARLEMDG